MWKQSLLSLTLILASCATPLPYTTESKAPKISAQAGTQENTGEMVARHLSERYNDARENCGKPSQPSFLCNGVLIRGTDYSTSYHSWDNTPLSHQKGAVSFSYLRKDSRYNKLAYGYTNGYVFAPIFYAEEKLEPEVLCSFPIDAGTNGREGTGCGATPNYPTSGPCQIQGITTATLWLNHYRVVNSSHNGQCGFDVRDILNNEAGPAFDASIKAMALLGTESFNEQNELRLAVWPDGQGTRLPLEAFFYIQGGAGGLQDAKNDQLDFKATTEITVPVISITLPQVLGNDAIFQYKPEDQAVPIP